MEKGIEERVDVSGSVSSTIGTAEKSSTTATIDYDKLISDTVISTRMDYDKVDKLMRGDAITVGLPEDLTYVSSYPTPSLVTELSTLSVSSLASEVEDLRRTLKEEMERKDTWTAHVAQAVIFQSYFHNFIKQLLYEDPEYTDDYLKALPKKIIREFCKDFIEVLYEDYNAMIEKEQALGKVYIGTVHIEGKEYELYNPKHVAKVLEKLGALKPEDYKYL